MRKLNEILLYNNVLNFWDRLFIDIHDTRRFRVSCSELCNRPTRGPLSACSLPVASPHFPATFQVFYGCTHLAVAGAVQIISWGQTHFTRASNAYNYCTVYDWVWVQYNKLFNCVIMPKGRHVLAFLRLVYFVYSSYGLTVKNWPLAQTFSGMHKVL